MSSPKPALPSLSPVLGNGTTIYPGIDVINLRMILDSSASLPSHPHHQVLGVLLPKHATSTSLLSVPTATALVQVANPLNCCRSPYYFSYPHYILLST